MKTKPKAKKVAAKTKKRVNAAFITKKLIPFILREQGRGFQMASWIDRVIPGKMYGHRDLNEDIKAPKCGTAACVGGSVQVLVPDLVHDAFDASAYLGLSDDEGRGLFYGWTEEGTTCRYGGYVGWPMKSVEAFEKADTALGKAKVACALLKQIIKTDGKCLHRETKN